MPILPCQTGRVRQNNILRDSIVMSIAYRQVSAGGTGAGALRFHCSIAGMRVMDHCHTHAVWSSKATHLVVPSFHFEETKEGGSFWGAFECEALAGLLRPDSWESPQNPCSSSSPSVLSYQIATALYSTVASPVVSFCIPPLRFCPSVCP